MNSHADLRGHVEKGLAPYAAREELSGGRVHTEPEPPTRGAWHVDRDRIVWSRAFRRLQYKTQVLTNQEGDYYRTRLTHTLEVIQIARTIARALGLHEDLTEAIALVHDLGHPPFGHAGEEALDRCLDGEGGFEHNAQALRVVDLLERGYGAFHGLNLTLEVREAIAKHAPEGSEVRAEFEAGPPLLEAQVVERADSIAYDAHDLDDGLKAGLIDEAGLEGLEIWERASTEAARLADDPPPRIRLLETIRAVIDLQVADLIDETTRRIREADPASPADVRTLPGPLVSLSDEMGAIRAELSDHLFGRLYRHHQVMRMARKARRIVTELFEEFGRHPDQLPPEHRAWCEEVGRERGVADYVAGMTDRYAQREYRQLFRPSERVLGP